MTQKRCATNVQRIEKFLRENPGLHSAGEICKELNLCSPGTTAQLIKQVENVVSIRKTKDRMLYEYKECC